MRLIVIDSTKSDQGAGSMGNVNTQDLRAVVDGMLAIVRRETLIVAIAMQANDDSATLLASGRLRWALDCVEQFAAITPSELARVRAQLVIARSVAEKWLPELAAESIPPERLQHILAELRDPLIGLRAICADNMLVIAFDLDGLPLAGISLRDATITHVSAKGARLECADVTNAKLLRSTFEGASLRVSRLDDAELEECNLSRANLEGASWRDATLTRCWAARAVFLNAHLERTRFVDCDLRDVDFQGATDIATFDVEFRNCDLRGTNWSGRDLSRVTFRGCRMYGIHGAATGLHDAVIEDADVSHAEADRRFANKPELLTRWQDDDWTITVELEEPGE
jgi:uncharacterized protein YjbI with pentapeptide repeats